MTISYRPAQRRPGLAVIGIAGPSGGGKSYSALRLARGLAGSDPFYVIDTENGKSEQLYGDKFQPWICGVMSPPYSPDAYVDAIGAATSAGAKVIVVDSISDEWEGPGGICEAQEAYLRDKAGDNFGRREALKMPSWAFAKEPHKRLVRELRAPRTHLILSMRAQDKIAMVKDEKGKMQVVPKPSLIGVNGWEPICEHRMPFECLASFLLLPDRPGIPRPIKLPEPWTSFVPLDQPISEETGAALAKWAAGDQATVTPAELGELTAELLKLADERGVGDKALQAVERHQNQSKASPAEHAEWLRGQIARMRSKQGAAA